MRQRLYLATVFSAWVLLLMLGLRATVTADAARHRSPTRHPTKQPIPTRGTCPSVNYLPSKPIVSVTGTNALVPVGLLVPAGSPTMPCDAGRQKLLDKHGGHGGMRPKTELYGRQVIYTYVAPTTGTYLVTLAPPRLPFTANPDFAAALQVMTSDCLRTLGCSGSAEDVVESVPHDAGAAYGDTTDYYQTATGWPSVTVRLTAQTPYSIVVMGEGAHIGAFELTVRLKKAGCPATAAPSVTSSTPHRNLSSLAASNFPITVSANTCLLYTSDAADD